MKRVVPFRLRAVVGLVAGLATLSVMAEEVSEPDAGKPARAEKIEVISTTPLPGIGAPIEEIPANVQSASSKNIEPQHTQDIADYINTNLGSVTINEGQSNPYMSDVFFRGFTASPLPGAPQGLSVFQDGVRINEPFGDTVNWGLIPHTAIASINLMPGSNPIFGLNTLGGALSINTKSGSQYPGLVMEASGGSWGRKGFNASYGGKQGDIDYFVTGNFSSEDGWREHSPSQVNQLFGKFGWQNDSSTLDLTLSAAHNNLEGVQALPRSWLNTPKQAYTYPDSVTYRMQMAALKGTHFIDENNLLAGNIYVRKSRIGNFASNTNDCFGSTDTAAGEECDQTLPDPTDLATQGFNERSSTDQLGWGFTGQYSYLADLFKHRNQLTTGFSFDHGTTRYKSAEQDTAFTGRAATPLSDFAEETNIRGENSYYGLFATDTFSVTDKFHLTMSGRYNYVRVKLKDYMGPDDNTGKYVTGDSPGIVHTFNRLNPAVGFNYNPNDAIGYYGAYNEGMRAPTPIELACADPLTPCRLPTDFLADPSLKPVVSKTWEAGLRGLFNSDWRWNASVFRSRLTDDIQFISSEATNFGYFKNVGETRRQGLELGLTGKVERLRVAANYQYLQATFQSAVTFRNENNSSADANGNYRTRPGDNIPNIPRHSLKLRLAYDVTRALTVGVNTITASSIYARGDENNKDDNGKIGGYTVVNLDANWRLNPNWTAFTRAVNIFDRDYQTLGVLGVNAFNTADRSFNTGGTDSWVPEQFRTPAPPRAAWFGLRYEFGTNPQSASGSADPD
ncbi:MAG TPA: TonB-dependent receptor [Methylophilaceae bacterium]|nr:TonB-dependent receptor [Methylophilaceae bacterium]